MVSEAVESTPTLPEAGQVVRVRTRTHSGEGVEGNSGYGTVVSLACLDDDAQDQRTQVIWELELEVTCPPSMIQQWNDEMEGRFGLTFEILDRSYVERIRQERGYGVSPWTTFPRFIVSHKLLIDEAYTGRLRDWLDNLRPGSLLIFDEAHHAAPSSGASYAIDSRITKATRDSAHRSEHCLFLSATRHNGRIKFS